MTTFEQLLALVGKTEGHPLPSLNALMERNEQIVVTYHFHSEHEELDDEDITVFESGYLLFRRGKHKTIWAVDRCKYMMFGDTKIQQSEFKDFEWHFPISHICEDRVQENIDSIDSKHQSTYEIEDIDILYNKGIAHGIEEEESSQVDMDKLEKALSVLTSQQRSVFEMAVMHQEMTFEEIAKKTGITGRKQAFKFFTAACKKLGIDHKKIRK